MDGVHVQSRVKSAKKQVHLILFFRWEHLSPLLKHVVTVLNSYCEVSFSNPCCIPASSLHSKNFGRKSIWTRRLPPWSQTERGMAKTFEVKLPTTTQSQGTHHLLDFSGDGNWEHDISSICNNVNGVFSTFLYDLFPWVNMYMYEVLWKNCVLTCPNRSYLPMDLFHIIVEFSKQEHGIGILKWAMWLWSISSDLWIVRQKLWKFIQSMPVARSQVHCPKRLVVGVGSAPQHSPTWHLNDFECCRKYVCPNHAQLTGDVCAAPKVLALFWPSAVNLNFRGQTNIIQITAITKFLMVRFQQLSDALRRCHITSTASQHLVMTRCIDSVSDQDPDIHIYII